MSDAGAASRAAELRLAFDRSFAEPRRGDTTAREDFLVIRLGAEAHALRLAEITGVFKDKTITRVPGRIAGLLGIAGFRGAIVPVYDLAALLGHPATEEPRWLVTAAAAPVAFAFDAFESHFQAVADEIVRQETSDASRRHVREFVHAQAQIRPVVQLDSVLDAIRNLGS